MIRLRKLNIRGFRGARFDLPLDFTNAYRSVAIFGENATGKSTITDALEWFLLDRVEHLWREDCKEKALRNVLIDDKDSSEVLIEFSDPALSGSKTLGPDFKTARDNTSSAFHTFLEKTNGERIILRHADITHTVEKTKGEKRQWITKIVGYQAVTDFRDAIQSTRNALQKEPDYEAAKQLADAAQSELFKLAQRIIESEKDLFAKLNELIAPYKPDVTISDWSIYEKTLKQLSDEISQPEYAKIKFRLGQLKKDCETFTQNAGTLLKAKDAFLNPYNQLTKDKSAVSQLNIGKFLKAGKQVIDSGHFAEQQCPFCLSEYDLGKLRKEVEARIEMISLIQGQYEQARTLKAAFDRAGELAAAACNALATNYADLEELKMLTSEAAEVLATLTAWSQATNSCFEAFQLVELPQKDVYAIKRFVALAAAQATAAESESEALKLSEQERRLLDTIQQMRDLRTQFFQYLRNIRTVRAFERQILSLSTIFDQFLPVQNDALQFVLDKITEDVGAYYATLHPNENVDKVRLSVIGEEGIEFEYAFHGENTYPPMKYLSESHINSLGICLFLASARLFNTASRFLILDDIVTSFDHGHRRRILRLIKEKFGDWQVILLTHERLWFDLIQKELAPAGWLFKEATWDDLNGIQLSETAADQRELIAEKRKKYDVSNDIRKLLESSLKEICQALEVKVAFRFNEQNERRMSGELLSELRATVNRKCASLKEHPSFANLDASNLIATVGSHDNPGETITGGDIDVALADIAALTDHFTCKDCGGYVDAKRRVPGKNEITCRCSKKALDWKQ